MAEDAVWEEIQNFLNNNPQPGDEKRFAMGEIRYSMGMHRYYLESKISSQNQIDQILRIVEEYGLKLDVREPPKDMKFNIVLWKGDEYIGRVDHTRLILMPQRLSRELFSKLLSVYWRK